MSISREVLAKYVRDGDIFIECGSRWGDTLMRAVECGAHAHGCELDPMLAGIGEKHVSEAFNGKKVIDIRCQDSVYYLRSWISTPPNAQLVVFLDAHTETESPVIQELNVIAQWMTKPKTILIDDMRLMPHWKIETGTIYTMLGDMGYKLSREPGVVPDDILVAQL